MNILMIAPEPFFEPRGTPFSVFGRLRELSHLGHDVDLVTYHVGEDLVIPRVAIFRTPVLRSVRHVPVGPSQTKLLLDVLLLFRALGQMLRKRYDLLHTHEEASFFGVLLAWACTGCTGASLEKPGGAATSDRGEEAARND